MVAFRLESYGVGDDRLIRYMGDCVVKEPMIKHVYNQGEEVKDTDELHRLNCENWYLLGSTICMASSLWLERGVPLEWNEAKVNQMNGHMSLSKLKTVFDYLVNERRFRLSHIVAKNEPRCLKYSIYNRNQYLDGCSVKLVDVRDRFNASLNIQMEFLNIISEIKSEFKVLTNQRKFVDISSLDLDYPATFCVAILFYDINIYHEDINDIKLWEIWEIHKLSSPFTPQQCLLSYYESPDKLLTKLTFAQNISHFIENNFILSINSSTVPVFILEDFPNCDIIYQLRKAQMCLLDRLIYIILAQQAYKYLKTQEIILSRFRVKYITSQQITFVYNQEIEINLNYGDLNYAETGETIWKLLVTKLRLLLIQYWKDQVFQNNLQHVKLLDGFLNYAIKIIERK